MNCNLVFAGLYVELLHICNRTCPYCYNDSDGEGAVLPKKIVFSLLAQARAAGVSLVSLSGGEPFLHPDMDEIIACANEQGVLLSIVTNLSFLAPQDAVRLLQRGNRLQLTLDSLDEAQNDATRGQGSYALVRGLLDEANRRQVAQQILLRFNMCKNNAHEIEMFVALAHEQHIKAVNLSFVLKSGRGLAYPQAFDSKSDMLELAQIMKHLHQIKRKYQNMEISFSDAGQRGCILFGQGDIPVSPKVDARGNVFLCQLFMGDENILGNVEKDSICDILQAARALAFVEKVRSRKENCGNCAFKTVCMCGCPAITSLQTDDIRNKDDQCGIIKLLIKNELKGALFGRAL
jgi:radical SAM protein with 4Fe4S-binding SPASM domain